MSRLKRLKIFNEKSKAKKNSAAPYV